jgi:hypothetical protein
MLYNKKISSFTISSFFMFLLLVITPFSASAWEPAYNTQFTTQLGTLGTMLNQILGFFQSGYMKAICGIALGGLGVGMIMNRGEPGMVKKFIPWMAAIMVILSLSGIMDIVFPTK